MLLTRRRFFSLLPAPLIVSAANIMQVKMLRLDEPTVYYVDPGHGDDLWDGTKENPWRTIAKLNSTSFQAGDTILFPCGTVIEERLELSAPVFLNVYR